MNSSAALHVCACTQIPVLGAASWLISKPSLSICSEPCGVCRQLSSLSLSVSDCLYPSLTLPHLLVLSFHSVHLFWTACWLWTPRLSGLFQPGLCLCREMMVNIRETATIIILCPPLCLSDLEPWDWSHPKSYFKATLPFIVDFFFSSLPVLRQESF